MSNLKVGFTRETALSGDLRLRLVVGEDNKDALADALKANNLMVFDEAHQLYQYNGLALTNMKNRLDDNKGESLGVSNGRNARLGSKHARGTCMVVGSAGNLNIDCVQRARMCGTSVLAMGNACMSIPFADYWLGMHGVAGYAPVCMLNPNCTSFVPLQYMKNPMWETRSRMQEDMSAEDCPNTVFFVETAPTFAHLSFGISTMGTDSTLPAAVLLAASLGFTDIVFSGVRLGGDLKTYFSNGYLPTPETIQDKENRYKAVTEMWYAWSLMLAQEGLRLYTIDADCPLEGVVKLDSEYFIKVRENELRKLGVGSAEAAAPVEVKQKKRNTYVERHQALVSHKALFEASHVLAEAMPEVFAKTVGKVAARVKASKNDKKGCTSCKFKRLVQPLLKLFVSEILKGGDEIHEAWAKAMPTRYLVSHEGKDIVRKDHENI